MRPAGRSGIQWSYARVNPFVRSFVGVIEMLNVRPSGLGSTVTVVLALVHFVNPVGPTFDPKLAALNVAFGDDDGDGGGDAL